jgi:hypothetical protein
LVKARKLGATELSVADDIGGPSALEQQRTHSIAPTD